MPFGKNIILIGINRGNTGLYFLEQPQLEKIFYQC